MAPQPRVNVKGRLIVYGVVFLILLSLPAHSGLGLAALLAVIRPAWNMFKCSRGWLARRRANRQGSPPAAALLGHNADGSPFYLRDTQLAAHGLILGATGSGKTTSLLTLLCDQIRRGAPVVAIDLKGSESFARQLGVVSAEAGRPFQAWSTDGPAHWNPLAYGNATELKDKLFGPEKFTEPHYQRAAERYLQTAIQVLQAVHPDRPVTLARVVDALDINQLRSLLTKAPGELIARVGPYLTQLSRDQQSAILGLQSRLALLSESNVGAYLEPGPGQIDLRHPLTAGNEVVLFSLNSSRYGNLAAQIAAMIVQDLIAVAGHRLTNPHRPLAIVAIDEFSALQADNILNLLARARESGISVLLSTQELADLERLATGFRDQVLGNTGIVIAHRQNVPASAELIAQMAGTSKVWQHTYQTQEGALLGGSGLHHTGLGTSKQVEEFHIHPNIIKTLGTGIAVMISKTPDSTVNLVRIKP